jgi:hypothetical protein
VPTFAGKECCMVSATNSICWLKKEKDYHIIKLSNVLKDDKSQFLTIVFVILMILFQFRENI